MSYSSNADSVPCRILEVCPESPTATTLVLEVASFLPLFAGQLVDVLLEQNATTATSDRPILATLYVTDSPLSVDRRKLRVSFRSCQFPPSCLPKITPGAKVRLMTNSPAVMSHAEYFTSDRCNTVVLLAGGAGGMMRLFSIVRYVHGLASSQKALSSGLPPDSLLSLSSPSSPVPQATSVRCFALYSCKDPFDMPFYSDLVNLAASSGHRFSVYFTATGKTRDERTLAGHSETKNFYAQIDEFSSFVQWKWPHARGRLDRVVMQTQLPGSTINTGLFYISGPPGFIASMATELKAIGVREKCIVAMPLSPLSRLL